MNRSFLRIGLPVVALFCLAPLLTPAVFSQTADAPAQSVDPVISLVSETSNDPVHYQVAYSEYVRKELRKLIARAEERGLGSQVSAAVREIDRHLHEYPQFGQPLIDLQHEQAQIWLATVPPLVVRYAIYESRREVWIVTPIQAMSGSGL